MKNGDISNELPKRIIVTTDVFLLVELTVKKRFKFISLPAIDTKMRRETLSFLYMYTTKQGITLELASFSMDDKELAALVDTLDNMGTNPFRYFTSYDSVDHLVAQLPYRPEVIGVLDTPDRLLRYGHWGLDIGSL